MPPKRQQLRTSRICFTLNNYTEDEVSKLKSWINETNVEFAIVGKEVGEQGTPHLQGFVATKPVYLKAREGTLLKWKAMPGLQRAHLEAARGSDLDSEKYCEKEGDLLIKVGTPGPTQDRWTRLLNSKSLQECAEICSETTVKSYHALRQITAANALISASASIPIPKKMNGYQISALSRLLLQDDRRILFVVDPVGGHGKSTLARILMVTFNAWACQGGKTADLMHAYSQWLGCRHSAPTAAQLAGNQEEEELQGDLLDLDVLIPNLILFEDMDYRKYLKAYAKKSNDDIAIFDMARCNSLEWYPWNFMENLKNGWFTSTKYDSGMRIFNPPKIVVFMNQLPPMDKFSRDRYDIFEIN